MPEPLQQVCVSLPPNLVALVQQHASVTDRTLGGMIRHVVSEWARSQPLPDGAPTFPARVLPSVAANPQAIAEAKARVTAMREEQAQIRRKKKIHGTTVAEDTRADEINFEIDLLTKRIALAEKMMPTNGG
jgi:hypothetical protein